MVSIFEIQEKVPGLNGENGLIREHFHAAKKRKLHYIDLIKSQMKHKHQGTVMITYSRYTCQLMDWDNHCASFKHLGDALVACEVIEDDKPSVVTDFIPMQFKVKKRSEEKIIIRVSSC